MEYEPVFAEKTAKRKSPETEQQKLDNILGLISSYGWSLGKFLCLLFSDFRHSKEYKINRSESYSRSKTHAKFVSSFLSGSYRSSQYAVSDLLSAIYDNPDSIPSRTDLANKTEKIARHQIIEWATKIVLAQVSSELAALTSTQTTELRLSIDQQNWEEVVQFSLADLECICKDKAPILFQLLLQSATSPSRTQAVSVSHSSQVTKVNPSKRDPVTVAVVAIMMIAATRNMQANYLQKILGLWLFSCSAPVQVYQVLCRLGITVAYSTVTDLFQTLTKASILTTKELAALRRFLIITDNINRYRIFFNPRLGQQNLMMSGAASTLVEILNYDPDAFDPKPLLEARQKQLRAGLTADMLWARIDQQHLSSVMALHCLDILISHCPALAQFRAYVTKEFRSTYAIHRMPDGHKTRVHPLSTTSIDEGSTEGCRNNLHNLLLHQLCLPPEVVNEVLTIIGGDLGMIEKLRNLIALESSCKHGFSSFKWVLPLVQLWHMGWADLARVVSTYWGVPNSQDPSTLWHNCALLGRKVKPIDRPDYYPAQRLVFDTLEADVIDCWRLLLGVDDLDTHFRTTQDPITAEQLFGLAKQLVTRWATSRAYTIALTSDKAWDGPKATFNGTAAGRSKDKEFRGDACLANSILRMRDSLIHREFVWSVADGDIGRVMQVMAVWQFTFTGSNKSKYATELLNLASGFLFEFPEALQTVIKDNWLCNLSGLQGCWMPMDLMQEHHIGELKRKVQRRDEDFEGSFFQNVVSRNIRWFTHTRSAVHNSLNLKSANSSHGALKDSATLNQLLGSLARERIHTFIAGRSFGYVSRDNLREGRRSMPDKVNHFIRRTVHLGGIDVAPSDQNIEQDAEYAVDEDFEPPAPAILIDGQLIPGDVPEPDLEDGNSGEPVW